MKRWQTFGAVLLAVTLVAALVVLMVLSRRQEPQEQPEPTKPLSTIKMSEVVRLTVRGADGRECRLEQDPQSHWSVVAPTAARADQNYVAWYLEDLLDTESSSLVPVSEIDLAKAGLVTPTMTIVLGLRGGGEQAVDVGSYAPEYISYYVRIGDQVCLIPWDIVDRAARMLDTPPLQQAPAAP